MSNTPPSLNAVVTKHNYLLPKLAKMELSELRLLTFCLAHYDARSEHRVVDETSDGIPIRQEFINHTATVQDLLDIFPGMGKQTAYAAVKQAVKGINSKPFEERFELPDGTTEDVLLYWFTGFRYNNERGQFTFRLSPDIVDMALSLDGKFTSFRLKHVYQFKSALTWKMYELLKQWVVAGRWPVGLDELRMSLGIPGKYPRWESLKTDVLEKSIKEINEQSDIIVRFEKKKRVRTVSGVVFFINSKSEEKRRKDPSLVATIGDTNNDIRLLMGAGLNQTNAEHLSRLAADANKDLKVFLERVIARYETKPESERGPKAAYIYRALYDEFSPSLFDGLSNSAVKPVTATLKVSAERQRAISQENNKYAKEAFSCAHYKTREEGNKCPAIKPSTKKCTVCNRLFKKN